MCGREVTPRGSTRGSGRNGAGGAVLVVVVLAAPRSVVLDLPAPSAAACLCCVVSKYRLDSTSVVGLGVLWCCTETCTDS